MSGSAAVDNAVSNLTAELLEVRTAELLEVRKKHVKLLESMLEVRDELSEEKSKRMRQDMELVKTELNEEKIKRTRLEERIRELESETRASASRGGEE